MALLDNGVPVAAESLLSSLTSLPTVLWLVRAHSVPLSTGPDVEDVGGCAAHVTPDGQLLPTVAELD